MEETPTTDSTPYLIVSSDSHAGPSLTRQLRAYCPARLLDDFDRYAESLRASRERVAGGGRGAPVSGRLEAPPLDPDFAAAVERTKSCAGLQDPTARERDMDADGVAADVIFAGGQNDEELPFLGSGFDSAGSNRVAPELRAFGSHIWNQWLADFVSGCPERHVGVMQIPIWDVDAAVGEVEWAHSAGLRAVNLPAPRADYPPYTSRRYDPLWALCQELQLPLMTHSGAGGGDYDLGDPCASLLFMVESHWFSRRGLPQMIFGGAFERFPELKMVFTESRVEWAPELIRHLDSATENPVKAHISSLVPRKPSEYWKRNCFLSGSFLAPHEVALRHEVGLENLMWGTDYPHFEGTWPRTLLSLRNTFWNVPEPETRQILGSNALRVFDLDERKLRAIADRIGPSPTDLRVRPMADELPAFRGNAFREYGSFA